jgi:hypothetical protein
VTKGSKKQAVASANISCSLRFAPRKFVVIVLEIRSYSLEKGTKGKKRGATRGRKRPVALSTIARMISIAYEWEGKFLILSWFIP